MSLRMTRVSRERAVSLRFEKLSAGKEQFTPRLDLSQHLHRKALRANYGRNLVGREFINTTPATLWLPRNI
jgi:hypothetical protein